MAYPEFYDSSGREDLPIAPINFAILFAFTNTACFVSSLCGSGPLEMVRVRL